MALELETQIMRAIGLDQHYTYFNGSGSCKYIREDAARRLPNAIQALADAGEKIVAPDQALMRMAFLAARLDGDQYTLTIAWQVFSYIIAAHIHAFFNETSLRQMEEYLLNKYPALHSPSKMFHPSWDIEK